jgi:hypothetical protein|nr:MAG TPA: hypothetical protein [Caudoviricetes sp.]
MNKYRHKETGVEIIIESEIAGDWELVEEVKTPTKKTKSEESDEE